MTKHYVLLLCFLITSQVTFAQKRFEKQWNTVEKHELEGKSKSAYEASLKILKKADRKNNAEQFLKAFLYVEKYKLILKDNSQAEVYQDFITEIDRQKSPQKQILASYLAESLSDYYQQNRYRIRQRTATKTDQTDFEAWDMNTFQQKIKFYYRLSLQSEGKLLDLPLKKFTAILEYGDNYEHYRSTLYDLLANRYLEYLKSPSFYSRSKQPYRLQDSAFFELPQKFVQLKIKTPENESNKAEILKLYQDLTRLHLQQKDSLSVLLLSLDRLEYIKQAGDFDNSSEQYLLALKNLETHFHHKKEKAWITYKLAEFYHSQADKHKHPDYLDKSLAAAEKTLGLAANSYPGKEAFRIKTTIESPKLTLRTVQFPLPQKKSRALVNFKNTDSLFLSVYRIPTHFDLDSKPASDSLMTDFFQQQPVDYRQAFQLPRIDNYFSYETEIAINALPVGTYILCVSNTKKTDFTKDEYQFQRVQVSNLSYTEFNKKTKELYVTDRNTGQPLKDVKAILGEKDERKTYSSNRKGILTLKNRNEYYRQRLMLVYEGDTLQNSIQFSRQYTSSSQQEADPQITGHLFTDRAIYRPGQTLYFKGILSFQKGEKERKVVPKEKVQVNLYDTNNQLVDSLSLKTNEFGSVHGEFKLPKNLITGDFQLKLEENFDQNTAYNDANFAEGRNRIKVEEYKRPKFEASFEPIDSTYVLNDSISLRGKANAFFGGNLTGAAVKYTIERSLAYDPVYRYRADYRSIQRSNVRLATGNTTTDSQGNFKIQFVATPDSSVTKKTKPVFTYTVEAAITDINGETHTTKQNLRIGYHATEVNFLMPYQLEIGNEEEVKISAKDLNGLAVKASGELKIYKYEQPNRILTQRSWPVPEIQQIPKEEFLENFPFTAYDSLDSKKNWPKKLVKTIPMEIDSIKTFKVDSWKNELMTGEYSFEFNGKGILGFPVEVSRDVSLLNPKNTELAKQSEFITFSSEINEKTSKKEVELKFYTPLDTLPVFLMVGYQDKIQKEEQLELHRGQNEFSFSIPKDVKLVHLKYIYNKNGHYEAETQQITVPQPKTQPEHLQFEVTTFHNKLEPGSNQTWELKVLDADEKPVQAEVLASMYDASLDQFIDHNWNERLYQASYHSYSSGLPYSSFGINAYNTVYFKKKNLTANTYYYALSPSFTKFKNFGYRFMQTVNSNKTYLKRLAEAKKKTKKGYASGVVTDKEGLPLPGVQVILKGRIKGTETDFDGQFSIQAKPGDVLTFSYIGMETKELPVRDKNMMVQLDYASNHLDQVVVTGYAQQKNAPAAPMENEAMADRVSGVLIKGNSSISRNEKSLIIVDGEVVTTEEFEKLNPKNVLSTEVLKGSAATALYGARAANGVIVVNTKAGTKALQQVETRTNLKETAFFFPQLTTNKKGEISFKFESPEALTRWKFQAFAHDKRLHQAKLELETLTQKDLNLLPNFPRFFRSKDTVVISAKVNNLSKKALNGIIQLEFTNELTQEKTELVTDKNSVKNFQIAANQNSEVSWKLAIPKNLSAVRYRIVAKAGNFSDGEENIIPVLSNRIFVTETLPIWVNPKEEKHFTFEHLKNTTSKTLKNHQLIFEYTSNPAWTALKALPYLIEYPYDCSEQTFARFYGNVLATTLLQKNPKIEKVLQRWKTQKTNVSTLEQNEELTQLLLQETPWLKTQEGEAQQQKRLAQLLDAQKSTKQAMTTLRKLKEMQMPSGGFPWFNGGRENRAISVHILSGFGRLQEINPAILDSDLAKSIVEKLIAYLDKQFLVEEDSEAKEKDFSPNLSYLYARSFFKDSSKKEIADYAKKTFTHYQSKWIGLPIQSQLTLAILAQKYHQKDLVKSILTSLKENAVINSDYGMYWKEVVDSRSWNNAPIATQALAIEVFSKQKNEQKTVNQLKTWLLRNKKTEAWKSTKATTEAIYALLIEGSQSVLEAEKPSISIGNETLETSSEMQSGYFKISFSAEEITPKKAEVQIKNTSNVPQYGGYYWQYFEESDVVKSNNQPTLSIQKQILKKVEDDQGSKLVEIGKKPLQIGDIVTIRLTLKAKESFSFMHLKDMRAAGLEPVDVLSKYKYQDGLGYYQSTRDVATNFFFDKINKGTYVFEYNLRVNNPGDFSAGITTLQSMYAPEFSVQSEGSRLRIEE